MFNDHEELLAGGAICGTTCAVAVIGALTSEGGENFFINILNAALVAVGAFFISIMFTLIGAVIYRGALGFDGIEEPSNWRIGVCVAVFVVIIAAIISM